MFFICVSAPAIYCEDHIPTSSQESVLKGNSYSHGNKGWGHPLNDREKPVPASVRKLCPGSQTLQTKPIQPHNQDYNVIIYMKGVEFEYPHWQFGHFLALLLKHCCSFCSGLFITFFFSLVFLLYFLRKKAEFPWIPPSCLLCWLSPEFISEIRPAELVLSVMGCSVLSSRWG